MQFKNRKRIGKIIFLCMTIYNTKEWFKAVVFIHKTDTFRKLVPYIIFMGIISWGIAYWELESLKLSDKSWVKNITTVHSLLGFVLSLLLVFRTNSAYDRWWEARKQWGALTNTSRNLAIKLNAYLPKEDTKNRNFYRKAIALYPQALFSFYVPIIRLLCLMISSIRSLTLTPNMHLIRLQILYTITLISCIKTRL